jgi:hypothetical protein
MSGELDDIGPDEAIDLAGGIRLQANSDAALALAVPFTGVQLATLERIALERGITSVETVQRLVEEALEARAHRDAA